MLIVIEGLDGSGKDSVADAVAKILGAARLNFPERSSVTGQAIDSYLRREWCAYNGAADHQLSALCMQSLALANRLERASELMSATLDAKDLVLARYWPSGWVYGQLDGLDRAWIDTVNAPFPQAQLYVLLDASPETCMARRAARDGSAVAPERYEGKLTMLRRTAALYRELWAREAAVRQHRWLVVDAEQPLTTVVEQVLTRVDGLR